MEIKPFRSYQEQLGQLVARGMAVADPQTALSTLHKVSYYRLSGYWYPFRTLTNGRRQDTFYPGSRFEDVVALYEFDERLRTAAFASLAPLELAVRAMVGHELGRIDPIAHLRPEMLGPEARSSKYVEWQAKLQRDVNLSREDFVAHHREAYGGVLPVWAAVEVLDWGGLSRLFSFMPRDAQDSVARRCGLAGPQLSSWLKCLNLVRNTCAHHGRLFNRVFPLKPRLPKGEGASLFAEPLEWQRAFGQLTLVQSLCRELGVGRPALLIQTLRTFPTVPAVPLAHTGAPRGWADMEPWRS